MGKVVFFVFLVSLLGAALSAEQQKEQDNQADSSVTSYSTVVIHHPVPKNKKDATKEGEEGRSQAYFKVKRLRASTLAPHTNNQQNGHNGGDFRLQNEQNGLDTDARNEQKSQFRPSHPDFKQLQNDERNHRPDVKAVNSDFKPSQYLPEPEIRVSFQGEKDQTGQGARHSEYIHGKEHNEPEFRRHKYKDNQGEEKQSHRWRNNFHYKPSQLQEDSKSQKTNQDTTQFQREVFIHHGYRPQNEKIRSQPEKQEGFPSGGFAFDTVNAIPAIPVEIANPFQTISGNPEQRLRPIPPPGMTEELIETLLSQQPQTFDAEPKVPLIAETKKKQKSPTFKVGYSIGFGNGAGDVVVGKPKDARLHVNGRNSFWKTLPQGVEMSQEIDKNKPTALKLEDNSFKSSDNVLKNDVYYMQNFKPDTSVPTQGRTSFNHAKALTNSNSFDFSNAMEDPKWIKHPRNLQPQLEMGRTLQPQLDMGGIYQSLGYPPPLPVLLPGGPRGEGTMVHAIVIPIEQISGFDYNWGNFPQVPMVPLGGQPVAQALTLSPVVTAAPLQQNPVPSQHQHQQQQLQQNPVPNQHQYQQQQQQQLHQKKPISTQNPQNHQDKQRFRVRTPKHREILPHNHKLQQVGSFSSAPIVVAPAPSNRQSDLQKELNNILAEEMMRKNQRLPAVGLRPPHAF